MIWFIKNVKFTLCPIMQLLFYIDTVKNKSIIKNMAW